MHTLVRTKINLRIKFEMFNFTRSNDMEPQNLKIGHVTLTTPIRR